ncbi:Fusaric acid resistance protein-like [Candidatus Nanopelagicus abundans]|uniref:Fusaric acid resistance protein-like n=1 Tax=Candidatus Nanopelagicus abundans TaxID=1884916 RepID=A0A249L3H2_9ACTN|nr:aromatic acid exporter family protein [Candidatus Nanopelagicus abundans]ASY23592.1 Fusaric acid resistance protein-like [Candidatus Nanopelagicus abundans]
MKRFFNWFIGLFSNRRSWVRQITVAAVASATAWIVGDNLVFEGGLVAAIVCALSIRISLYKSVREGLGQIVGTAIGAGVALLTVHYFSFGVIAIGLTVFLCSVVARGLRLGEVASVNVPVTALIVIGPGISGSTAEHRLVSTLIGAAVAIVFSYFSHASTPAGRTVNQISRLGIRSAELISEMAEGVAAGFTQKQSGAWLSKARLLVEEIPILRSQAIEAKRYARWSPLAEVDEAESLYIQGIAIEHMLVQIRSMARTLFDATLDPARKDIVDRQVAYALSATSSAITEKLELLESENRDSQIDNIARDLRLAADNLTEELIEKDDQLPRSQFVRCISLVSQMKIIANSLDESSPALYSVSTPGEPSSAQVIAIKPVKLSTKLGKKISKNIRTFLHR